MFGWRSLASSWASRKKAPRCFSFDMAMLAFKIFTYRCVEYYDIYANAEEEVARVLWFEDKTRRTAKLCDGSAM